MHEECQSTRSRDRSFGLLVNGHQHKPTPEQLQITAFLSYFLCVYRQCSILLCTFSQQSTSNDDVDAHCQARFGQYCSTLRRLAEPLVNSAMLPFYIASRTVLQTLLLVRSLLTISAFGAFQQHAAHTVCTENLQAILLLTLSIGPKLLFSQIYSRCNSETMNNQWQQQQSPLHQPQWTTVVPGQNANAQPEVLSPQGRSTQQGYSTPSMFQQFNGPIDPGSSNDAASNHHTSTTTTTTSSQTINNSGFSGQRYLQQPMAQLTGQMQSMQMQQQPPPMQAQIQAMASPVRYLPSPQQAYQTPPPQPLSAPPIANAPALPMAQTTAPIQTPSNSSVTVEQRTFAFEQWRLQNLSKPTRTIERIKAQYTSGQKDKEVYDVLVKQQQAQQAQATFQAQQITQQSAQQDTKAAAAQRRQQRTVERQQREAVEEKSRRQAVQQEQENQRQLAQPVTYGGSGSNTTTTTTTTNTTQMLLQQGATSGAGQHRRQAMAEGESAVQALDQRIQIALRQLGICPRGFQWLPVSDGYMCYGGNHYFTDVEIDKMLNTLMYFPRMTIVNAPRFDTPMGDFGPPMGFYPLKKPPEQVPKRAPCWMVYNEAKGIKQFMEGGMAGRGAFNYGLFNGLGP